LAGGCSLFTLYVGLAIFLAFRGVEIGVSTSYGAVAIAICATPIGLAILMQLAQGVRRLAVDGELNSRIRTAEKEFEVARGDADIKYREQVASQREALAAAEAALAKVEEARQCLLAPLAA
jgi:hypothetical protein